MANKVDENLQDRRMTAGTASGTGALRIWVLADPRPGTAAQALAVGAAVAETLHATVEVKPLSYRGISRLPNWLLGANWMGVTGECRAALAPPWPDILIGAGRRSAPVARAIKRRAGGNVFAVQIMYPGGAGLSEFDLIAVPNHDQVREASNMIRMTGAAHGMTSARLETARGNWGERFSTIAAPRIGVLVGGATQRRDFSPTMARELGALCAARAKELAGSLMISTSRRTPPEATEALLDEITNRGVTPAMVYKWGDPGDNPYDGLIAYADLVVVTGDSISMCCEAAASCSPVEIFAPPGFVSSRHQRFINEMVEHGYARPAGGEVDNRSHTPLNPAGDITEEIRRRMERT